MQQKLFKQLVTYVSLLGFAFCLSGIPSTAATVQAATEVTATEEETAIARRKDVIYWVYKEDNGKLYKRLWNSTNACWIGDWIFVKDM